MCAGPRHASLIIRGVWQLKPAEQFASWLQRHFEKRQREEQRGLRRREHFLDIPEITVSPRLTVTFASNTRSYTRRNSFRFATLYLPFTRGGKCTISATTLRSFRSTTALSFSKKAIALGASFRRLSAVSLPHADSDVAALCPTPFVAIVDNAKTAIKAVFVLEILHRT